MFRLFPLIALLLAGTAPLAVPPQEEFVSEERQRLRDDFQGIGVEEKTGEYLDLSIPFVDHHGNEVTLADYVVGDVPLVLTFVYHDCPMLCSLVLDGFSDVIRQSTLRLGTGYRALAISFDPDDSPFQSKGAHERYAAYLPDGFDPESFVFLTGSQDSIDRITEAAGFQYRWIEERQEYAHTATLVFLSPEGLITRYLYGITHAPTDFRATLVEAGQGTIGTPLDQLFLYCFVYDPQKGGYTLQAIQAMKLGGMLTFAGLLGGLLVFWRRERKRQRARLAVAL